MSGLQGLNQTDRELGLIHHSPVLKAVGLMIFALISTVHREGSRGFSDG